MLCRGRSFRIRIYESIAVSSCGDDAIASFTAKNKTFWLEKSNIICTKNCKFINGCKANKNTHKTAKSFLTSNIYGTDINAIDLRITHLALMPISA